MTSETRSHIRLERDRLARLELRRVHVAYCSCCGRSFDRKGGRKEMCDICLGIAAEPAPLPEPPSLDERRELKNRRQRLYRKTPSGRAAHARSQARWRERRQQAV